MGNRSRWREFVEGRDALLSVVALPCLPSELLRDGPRLGRLLRERSRERKGQMAELGDSLSRLMHRAHP